MSLIEWLNAPLTHGQFLLHMMSFVIGVIIVKIFD